MAGATGIGPRPARTETLENFPAGDAEVARLADELWTGKSGNRRVLAGKNARELAEVQVNGQSCGIVWSPPFRVDVTAAVKPGVNRLEIEVVNFWPNRVIGDAGLPLELRLPPPTSAS